MRKPKTPFHSSTEACAPGVHFRIANSLWRLKYAHRDVWRELVCAFLGRCSYRTVYICIQYGLDKLISACDIMATQS